VAGDAFELARQPVGIAQVLVERPLGADRFVGPVGPDFALVDAATNAPIPFGRTAEMGLQRGDAPVAKIGAGGDAEAFHLARGDRADAMETGDRQRRDEVRALLGRDDAQAIRLAVIRGELGDELAVTDAGRGGEAGFLTDSAADVFGDRASAAE